jgi:hypothetical protein
LSVQQILRELEGSILLAPDFPRRIRVTAREFDAMSKAERVALHEISLEAMARACEHVSYLEAMVRRLGATRYEPAVPLLSRLWRECALAPVWLEAGHALLDIATPQAWDALEGALEDADSLARALAVCAMFSRDVRLAYEALAPRFALASSRADPVCLSVLEFLTPSFTVGVGPTCRDGAVNVLRQDSRWLDLCAKLFQHEHYGAPAYRVLQHAGAEEPRTSPRRNHEGLGRLFR